MSYYSRNVHEDGDEEDVDGEEQDATERELQERIDQAEKLLQRSIAYANFEGKIVQDVFLRPLSVNTQRNKKPCSECKYNNWQINDIYFTDKYSPWGSNKFCLRCMEDIIEENIEPIEYPRHETKLLNTQVDAAQDERGQNYQQQQQQQLGASSGRNHVIDLETNKLSNGLTSYHRDVSSAAHPATVEKVQRTVTTDDVGNDDVQRVGQSSERVFEAANTSHGANNTTTFLMAQRAFSGGSWGGGNSNARRGSSTSNNNSSSSSSSKSSGSGGGGGNRSVSPAGNGASCGHLAVTESVTSSMNSVRYALSGGGVDGVRISINSNIGGGYGHGSCGGNANSNVKDACVFSSNSGISSSGGGIKSASPLALPSATLNDAAFSAPTLPSITSTSIPSVSFLPISPPFFMATTAPTAFLTTGQLPPPPTPMSSTHHPPPPPPPSPAGPISSFTAATSLSPISDLTVGRTLHLGVPAAQMCLME